MSAFPMILIAVILYNLAVFGGGAAGLSRHAGRAGPEFRAADVFRRYLAHHGRATCSCLLALVMLFVETVRAARHNQPRNAQSCVFDADLLRGAGGVHRAEGIFHLGLFPDHAMCLFDVVAGYTISIVAAKRDLAVVTGNER